METFQFLTLMLMMVTSSTRHVRSDDNTRQEAGTSEETINYLFITNENSVP